MYANVLLVRFTRTAMAELHNRISKYVGREAVASGIRIATLDSASWSLQAVNSAFLNQLNCSRRIAFLEIEITCPSWRLVEQR